MSEAVHVRRAGRRDAPHLANVLAAAYHDEPVSRWLLRGERDRTTTLRAFFDVLVEHVMTFGTVTTTDPHPGVALWLEVGPEVSLLPDQSRLAPVLGDRYRHYALLHRMTDALRPCHAQHVFLPYLGVDPEYRRQGVGTALVRHAFAELEANRLPVYLEATSLRNRGWCEGLGFRRLPVHAQLPDGPALWSMWCEGTWRVGRSECQVSRLRPTAMSIS